MNEYTAWQLWIQENTVVILALIAVGFAALVKTSHTIWQQHKEFEDARRKAEKEIQAEREKTEKSEMGRVADKLQDLVDQIKFLFTRQDDHGKKLQDHSIQIGELKTDIEGLRGEIKKQDAKCSERGKFVDEKLKTLITHKRVEDPPLCDRTDRSD